jgi:hypothetical protein
VSGAGDVGRDPAGVGAEPGAAFFAYTPAGEGDGLALYTAAMTSPEWFVRKWDITQTTDEHGQRITSPEDEAQMRRDGISESAIRRDLYCSFETPVAGAIYAVEMERMLVEDRITSVPWQAGHPGETA